MAKKKTKIKKAAKDYPKLPVIERKIVPAIREGIELVMMIVFMKLKEKNVTYFPEMDKTYHSMLAAAVLNTIFGITNPEESFQNFLNENEDHVQKGIKSFATDFPDLNILITDALRMQFICNEVEEIGDKDHDIEVMEKAIEAGILLQERDAPLPKGFMNLVHRVGMAHGLIRRQ